MGYDLIDISHHKTVTNWSELKKNVPFLIFKATQRCDFVDPKFIETVKKCEQYGVPYWTYSYLEKGNEVLQTAFLIKTCKENVGENFMGFCLDAEEKNSPDDILKALAVLKEYSRKSILYTGYSDYKLLEKAITNRGEDVAWHEARYGLNNGKYNSLFKPHAGVDLHQYTDKGKVSYISEKVDMNRLTGTLDLKWFTDKHYGLKKEDGSKKLYYPFEYPTLPIRGYYKLWDGMKTYKDYREEIKKVQKLTNWLIGTALMVDGMYGARTTAAVKKMQKVLKVSSDGEFGKKTLAAAKEYYK